MNTSQGCEPCRACRMACYDADGRPCGACDGTGYVDAAPASDPRFAQIRDLLVEEGAVAGCTEGCALCRAYEIAFMAAPEHGEQIDFDVRTPVEPRRPGKPQSGGVT